MARPPDALDLPRRLGAYTLLHRLAVGGMAEVYVAKARGLGGFEKLVALKVIHPRFSEDRRFVQMLVEEAKLSVLLNHPNIVQTFDLGFTDGTYFIVMELVEGVDAYRVFRRANERRKRIPLDLCVHMVGEICRGLDYAHRRRDVNGAPLGVVHRDVSPQNVLLSFGGEVKLTDFGIAKATQRGVGDTEVGVIKGKYYYMSPEQAWGDPVDPRSDVFSAGIVLHELMCNRMVYRGENLPQLLDAVRQAEVAPPSRHRADIPPELDAVVMKACAKEPDARYASAGAMAEALAEVLHALQPGFHAGRLVALLHKLFPDEVQGVARYLEPSSEESRPSSAAARGATRMRQNEFRPDLSRSKVFDLQSILSGDVDAPPSNVETQSGLHPSEGGAEEVGEDEQTLVQSGPVTPEIRAFLAEAGRARDAADIGTFEDATLIDETGELMSRMRDALERYVAGRNRPS
ncbi:MAG: serine/threonine-protein kinase, partial [Myxococcota bacterium]